MSAAKGLFNQVPDAGITKKYPRVEGGEVQWVVDLAVYSMSTSKARQLAAELLNLSDMADKLNEEIGERS